MLFPYSSMAYEAVPHHWNPFKVPFIVFLKPYLWLDMKMLVSRKTEVEDGGLYLDSFIKLSQFPENVATGLCKNRHVLGHLVIIHWSSI